MEEILQIIQNDNHGQVSQYVRDNLPLIKFLSGENPGTPKSFLERALTQLMFSYHQVIEPNQFPAVIVTMLMKGSNQNYEKPIIDLKIEG